MKRVILPLILIIGITLGAISQNESTITHRTKASLGITFSPDFYLYSFKIQKTNQGSNYELDQKSTFNYSLGATGVWYPIRLLSLRMSVLYSTKGYELGYSYDATNPGTTVPDYPTFSQPTLPSVSKIKADYLDVPFILNFNIVHKDMFQFFVSGGIIPSFLLSKAATTKFENGEEASTDALKKNIKSFMAMSTFSLGVKVNMTPTIGMGFEPYFRYFLDKQDSRSMEENPLSFGGKVSLMYNFNRK